LKEKISIQYIEKEFKKIIINKNIMEQDPNYDKVLTFHDAKRNITWLKKSSYVKPIDLLNKYLEKDEILFKCVNKMKSKGVCYEGHFFAKCKWSQYVKIIKENRYIYEIIPADRARRCYFDLDGGNINCLKNAIKIIKELFGDDVPMSISGKGEGMYKGKKKWSYHIVLPTIIFKNKDEMKYLKLCIGALKNDDNGLDNLVYGSNQAIKAINQSKDRKDKRIQKIIQDNKMTNHIISYFGKRKANGASFNKVFQKYIQVEEKKFKKKLKEKGVKIVNIKNYNNFKGIQFLNVPPPHIDFEFGDPLEILFHIPNTKPIHKLGKKAHYLIGNWAYNKGITYQQYRDWEKRHYNSKNTTYTTYGDWLKYKESKFVVSTYKIKNILECFYGNIPNPRIEKFKKQFIKGHRPNATIINAPHIYDYQINNKKYQILYLEMGKGKTYAIIEYLIKKKKVAKENNVPLKVCWITNRISMALNLMGRLNLGNDKFKDTLDPVGRNLGFVNYKDIEKGANLRDYDKIVIELESLCRIGDVINPHSERIVRAAAEYDIVIIDEIESVFNSFSNDTTHQNGLTYDRNYHTFEKLLRTSTQVFLMDAYLHYRSIEYIKILDKATEDDIHFIQSKEVSINKSVNIHNTFFNWFNTIIDDVIAGRKLYIFYPYKTGKGSSLKLSIEGFQDRLIEAVKLRWNRIKMEEEERLKAENPNMEYGELKNLIINHLQTLYKDTYEISKDDFKVYHGDSCDKAKRKLIDANKEWANIKIVITNSSISVGVNYDGKDFHKVYLGYADIISPRDTQQSSFRVRHPQSNTIEFYYFPNTFKSLCEAKGEQYIPRPFNKPKLEENTPAFKYMRKFLLEEYNAKSVEILFEYFKATNYKINNEFQNNNSSPKLFRNCKSEKQGVWEYNDIDPITKEQKNKYELMLLESNATMLQKLKLNKYFSDQEFRKGVNPLLQYVELDKLYEIRKKCYEKPQIAEGFKKLWCNDTILNYALFYINKSHKYIFNNKKLTMEQKQEIENFLHLSHFGNVGKYHRERFLKLKDNIIKKHIIQFYFGRDILQPVAKIKRGNLWDDGDARYILNEPKFGELWNASPVEERYFNEGEKGRPFPSTSIKYKKRKIISMTTIHKVKKKEKKKLTFFDLGKGK
jgi:hypothetical protein